MLLNRKTFGNQVTVCMQLQFADVQCSIGFRPCDNLCAASSVLHVIERELVR